MSDKGTCENCLFASYNNPCTTDHIEEDGDCWVSKDRGYAWWRLLFFTTQYLFYWSIKPWGRVLLLALNTYQFIQFAKRLYPKPIEYYKEGH